MPVRSIIIRDRIATAEKGTIVCDNSDYEIHFDFDGEWSDYEVKTMVVEDVYHQFLELIRGRGVFLRLFTHFCSASTKRAFMRLTFRKNHTVENFRFSSA